MSDYTLKYARKYIQTITTSETASPPDKQKSGSHLEVLNILYENHSQGGLAGAVAGWNVLKKIYKHLDTNSKLINFHDLGSIPIPDYVLPSSADGTAPNYPIYRTGMNLLYGEPGSGKSFVGIDIAAHVSLAYPDNVVIYSAGEGIPGLQPRLKAWETHHKATVKNLFLWRDALPFMREDEVNHFLSEVSDLKPVLLIVDTLARSMVGLNENDTREVGLYNEAVERVMEQLGCGILFIHHTNKTGVIRGSTVFAGSMDSILKLSKEEESIAIYNSLDRGGKNKHREEAPPMFFRLLPVEVNGNKEATIVMSDKIIEDNDAPLNYNQEQILDCIRGSIGIATNIIIEMTDIKKSTVYYNLKALKERGLIQEMNGLWTIVQSG